LSPSHTPFEQANELKQVMPASAHRIDHVAGLFVREQYGRLVVDRSEARSIWSQLHWKMWQAGLVRRLPRSISPFRWLKFNRLRKVKTT
jgi:predicted acetyltransferase